MIDWQDVNSHKWFPSEPEEDLRHLYERTVAMLWRVTSKTTPLPVRWLFPVLDEKQKGLIQIFLHDAHKAGRIKITGNVYGPPSEVTLLRGSEEPPYLSSYPDYRRTTYEAVWFREMNRVQLFEHLAGSLRRRTGPEHCIAVIGASGSGKSTLLEPLTGSDENCDALMEALITAWYQRVQHE
jgi:hypothetical protein